MKECRYCREEKLVVTKSQSYGIDAINKNNVHYEGSKSYIFMPYYCEKCGYTEFFREEYDREKFDV